MSDEDERERFEVTDYDLASEFNPNRFRRNFSKNQQIYGVWADDSDEEGVSNNKNKPKWNRGGSSGSGSGNKYVAFVSAGIQGGTKNDKPEEDKEEEQQEDDIPVTDTSSDEEVEIVKAFGKSIKQPSFSLDDMAGMRRTVGFNIGSGKGIEMYGKGASMALKMGFQPGKGLGKDLQGISAPIEASVRRGRGAIGAYGKEAKTQPSEVIPEGKKVQKVAEPKEQKWLKGQGPAKKKVEYQYMTADDVLNSKQLRVLRPDAGALAKVKVVDMTGPEQRVLSGYHAISGKQKPSDEWELERAGLKEEAPRLLTPKAPVFDLTELIHNIDLLKDSYEQDILKNDRKLRYATDRRVAGREEEKELMAKLKQDQIMESTLETLVEEVTRLTEDKFLTLNQAFVALGTLKTNYPDGWKLYQLHALVPAIAIPLVQQELQNWNPLSNPTAALPLVEGLRDLLTGQQDQFEMIMWECWMPKVRQANLSWNVKNAESMLSFIEIWRKLVPVWTMNNILEQLILPKIQEGVELWNPLLDEIPIHSWIHPWLPILGSNLEIVYPTIRSKLGNALVKWHPSDISGKEILTPWVTVFSKGSMDTFLLKNIVPKLKQALDELVINPHNQSIDQWNWVMNWKDMLPMTSLITLLDESFFPKWLQGIVAWLNHRPAYEEVYRWYTWWRSLVPEQLLQNATIQGNLQKALEIISASLKSPGEMLNLQHFLRHPSIETVPMQHVPIPTPIVTSAMMADAIRMTSQVPQGFRDLVQMKCEEIGLMFLPLANRFHDGKQVYRCGNVMLYIDANVVYVHKEGNFWIPMSIHQLLQVATS